MELLLNLVWLLLVLPAFFLWRNSSTGKRLRFSPAQCLLALACGLVMLFPVVSATDDLHAMRAEMEESPASKRNLRQAGNERASAWNGHSQNPPALLAIVWSLAKPVEHGSAPLTSQFVYSPTARAFHAGRAPPAPTFA